MSLLDRIRRKKKKPIEGYFVINNPDIKVATVSHNGKPFVVGIGTTEKRQMEGEAAIILPIGGRGKYQTQKVLKWEILHDPTVFPQLKPIEKIQDVAASSIALASGSADALRGAQFRETELKKLRKLENTLIMLKPTPKPIDVFQVLREQGLELDHVVPLDKGGKNELSNLRVVRKEDNRKKANRKTS